MTQVRTNDANNANTNRIVRFDITVNTAAYNVNTNPGGGAVDASDIFAALEGPNYNYKHYGKVQNPTQAQILAQLRLSLVTRTLSRYAILVGVQVADVTTSGETSNALRLEFETDRTGVYYNNDWSTDQSVDKNIVTDIADTVGTGGMNSPKTKAGLQTMLDELASVSYDDGVTYIFGFDSTAGVTLPDGTSATGPSLAPSTILSPPVASGLVVTWDNPAAI